MPTNENVKTNGNKEVADQNGISDVERKKLFQAYEKADATVNAATKALDVALEARSKCVQEISERSGNGPYRFQGVKTSIMARLNKTTGKNTFFFRQPAEESKLIDVP